MTVLTILITGALNIACFFIGAKVGQMVSKGETLELPSVNPFEKIREIQDKQEARKEQDRIDTIMRNIENYDGTDRGQEDVPKG